MTSIAETENKLKANNIILPFICKRCSGFYWFERNDGFCYECSIVSTLITVTTKMKMIHTFIPNRLSANAETNNILKNMNKEN